MQRFRDVSLCRFAQAALHASGLADVASRRLASRVLQAVLHARLEHLRAASVQHAACKARCTRLRHQRVQPQRRCDQVAHARVARRRLCRQRRQVLLPVPPRRQKVRAHHHGARAVRHARVERLADGGRRLRHTPRFSSPCHAGVPFSQGTRTSSMCAACTTARPVCALYASTRRSCAAHGARETRQARQRGRLRAPATRWTRPCASRGQQARCQRRRHLRQQQPARAGPALQLCFRSAAPATGSLRLVAWRSACWRRPSAAAAQRPPLRLRCAQGSGARRESCAITWRGGARPSSDRAGTAPLSSHTPSRKRCVPLVAARRVAAVSGRMPRGE